HVGQLHGERAGLPGTDPDGEDALPADLPQDDDRGVAGAIQTETLDPDLDEHAAAPTCGDCGADPLQYSPAETGVSRGRAGVRVPGRSAARRRGRSAPRRRATPSRGVRPRTPACGRSVRTPRSP